MTHYLNHKEIDFLKALLMVGIVLIHCNIAEVYPDCSGAYIIDFFSEKLASLCVPCFFFISGFLFFNNIDGNVGNKLKKRVASLVIPYLLWNLIAMLTFLLKKYCFYQYFPNYDNIDVTVLNLIKGFWSLSLIDDSATTFPFDFVLWFIRDLIIVVYASGFLYRFRKLNFAIAGILYLMVAFDLISDPYEIAWAFIFFNCGGMFRKYGSRVTSIAKRLLPKWKAITAASLVLILFVVFRYVAAYSDILINIVTIPVYLCAIISLMTLIRVFNCDKTLRFSSQAIFFIYAAHGLWVTLAKKFVVTLIAPTDSLKLLTAYCLLFICLWFVDYFIYRLLAHISPKFTSVLCGSR